LRKSKTKKVKKS